MKSYEKFLQFNGRNIYFVAVNGQYYIAYKPICEALNIEANRCYKNLKKHKILGKIYAFRHIFIAVLAAKLAFEAFQILGRRREKRLQTATLG